MQQVQDPRVDPEHAEEIILYISTGLGPQDSPGGAENDAAERDEMTDDDRLMTAVCGPLFPPSTVSIIISSFSPFYLLFFCFSFTVLLLFFICAPSQFPIYLLSQCPTTMSHLSKCSEIFFSSFNGSSNPLQEIDRGVYGYLLCSVR